MNTTPPFELTQSDFERLRSYIHTICGLHIPEEKQYLVMQRLEKLVHEKGCTTFHEFANCLENSSDEALRTRIIEAITTHETSFFRDGHPFRAFQSTLLPMLGSQIKQWKAAQKDEDAPGRKIRIWCAGASTGQEPYSLAMLVRDYVHANCFLGIREQDFAILATDISAEVIEKAQKGRYNEVEIARGLSEEVRERHFARDGNAWVLREEVRSLVEYRQMNLAEPFGLFATFDVIFCRNVLIYFDDATKRHIIENFHRKLADNGFLVLGSAENLYALSDRFESTVMGETILYRKKQGA